MRRSAFLTMQRSAFFKVKWQVPASYAAFQDEYETPPVESDNPEPLAHEEEHPTEAPNTSLEHQHTALLREFLHHVNAYEFNLANPLLRQLQAGYHMRDSRHNHDAKIAIYKPHVRVGFFPTDFSSPKKRALQHALPQLRDLLANPQQCSELFKKLDADIAAFQQHLHCDFSQLSPGPGLLIGEDYIVPSESILQTPIIDTHDVLLYLLRKQLAKDGIDTQDDIHIFFEFINEPIANNLVRQGMLFCESPLAGNALFHGIYSHYLQWYLFSVAVEKGIVQLNSDITLLEIMSAMVDSKVTFKAPLWSTLIDHAYAAEGDHPVTYFQRFLGSPYNINTFLITSPATPHLRGYLLNEWIRDITMLQSFFYQHTQKEISYELLVTSFAAANENFEDLHLQITKNMIADFYKSQKKKADPQTGIVLESAQEKLAWASAADREIQSIKLLSR